eukprot:TRINITY_DN59661_c0_g1_i1.p1 TRINITY_DN59661_c0_g1~~TRINITY_DN59661_c0_g1_i1.p1  ORF type:complete len:488 (-),score=58.93 TRINITY_DN59661_c0_g1_i1:128-1399(-)
MGIPFFGHTLDIFRMGIENWGNAIRKKYAPFEAALLFYLFQPTVVISHKLYKEHVQHLDNAGDLVPLFPPGFDKLLGKHSMITLPGGKGHTQHHRIRAKCLRALAPLQVLGQLKMIQDTVRTELEAMASCTQENGCAKLCPAADNLTLKVSATMILGADLVAEAEQLRTCYHDVITGLFAPPMNLGRFSAHGRALLARQRLRGLVEHLSTKPTIKRTALGELLIASEEGEPLSQDEISDSVLTMLLAGQLTTKDAIPRLVSELAERPDIVEKIRSEASMGFESIEQDSSTFRFLIENLRRYPPAGAFRRMCPSHAIELGKAGRVPKGCSMALFVTDDAFDDLQMDNPLYLDRQAAFEKTQSVFGGKQPHSCVGKNLALLELQVFLRELCGNYQFEVLESIFEPKMGGAGWKHDFPVRVTRRVA